jgi:hypothetical protein
LTVNCGKSEGQLKRHKRQLESNSSRELLAIHSSLDREERGKCVKLLPDVAP